MKVGVQINRFDFPGGEAKIGSNLKTVAQAAESAGFDSIWVMDHFFQLKMLGPKDDPMMEAYTTLGYLAGVTSKAMLGTMVTGVIYREPAVLIKAVTALDVVSGGRAYFGIGAGWNDEEAKALGLLDPLNSKRFERLEDTLKLAKQMWAGDRSAFHGTHYNLPEPISVPAPVQKPHPPILVGGSGEQKTLRFVAEYGDACNLFAADMDTLKHKLQVLQGHCKDVGRDYNEIEKTALAARNRITDAAADPEDTLAHAKEMAELGIQHVIYGVSNDANPESYEKFRKIADEIHAL
jgi:F420-dependent oxidoreductase-like protein